MQRVFKNRTVVLVVVLVIWRLLKKLGIIPDPNGFSKPLVYVHEQTGDAPAALQLF
jgi:hypothetical protein